MSRYIHQGVSVQFPVEQHGSADTRNDSVQSLMKLGLDPVMSLKDTAALLGCHPDTVRTRGREGKIKILRMSPRRLGVHVSEIRRFLDGCARA